MLGGNGENRQKSVKVGCSYEFSKAMAVHRLCFQSRTPQGFGSDCTTNAIAPVSVLVMVRSSHKKLKWLICIRLLVGARKGQTGSEGGWAVVRKVVTHMKIPDECASVLCADALKVPWIQGFVSTTNHSSMVGIETVLLRVAHLLVPSARGSRWQLSNNAVIILGALNQSFEN